MPHYTPLIATIVGGLVLAFVLGALANRLRLSPLAGYLVAGVLAGPFTPGFVADQTLASQLAEIGVILLMFGVGLHFSLKDLLSVRAIALPGAVVQITIATLLGIGLSWAMGWSLGAGIVFGLALSTASTVVLLRALQEHRLVETERGRIAVGWLIVQDLAMVLVLVLLPSLAGFLGSGNTGFSEPPGLVSTGDIAQTLAITIGKVAAFIALMLVVGRRVVPWILHYVAHTGSRELFRLAVLAIALGIAYGSAELFGVSFALGAFFAGMVMSESQLSQQAAAETLPLRDAFAVLFFVSVGMLFDPAIVVHHPWPLIATILVIVIGNPLAAFLIVRAFRQSLGTALTIAASLAQIGEFSFILAGLGVALDLLPQQGLNLILAGAMLSILANPLLFAALDRLKPWLERREKAKAGGTPEAEPEPDELPVTALKGHAVLIGFGRVGNLVGEALRREEQPLFVIEERQELVEQLRRQGVEAIYGNAAAAEILKAANLPEARWLLVAIPNAFEAGQIIRQARTASPGIEIIARAHSDAEVDHLQQNGADLIIMGEREIARGMVEHTLGRQAPPATAAAAPL